MLDLEILDDLLTMGGGMLMTLGVCYVFLVSWPTERPPEDDR